MKKKDAKKYLYMLETNAQEKLFTGENMPNWFSVNESRERPTLPEQTSLFSTIPEHFPSDTYLVTKISKLKICLKYKYADTLSCTICIQLFEPLCRLEFLHSMRYKGYVSHLQYYARLSSDNLNVDGAIQNMAYATSLIQASVLTPFIEVMKHE